MEDRRAEPRLRKLQLTSAASWPGGPGPSVRTIGRTLDLSRRGMKLESTQPIAIQSRVDLQLALGETIIEVEGVVRFVEDIGEGRFAMGLSFEDVSSETQAHLDEFVKDG
jgi:hypothetical protein